MTVPPPLVTVLVATYNRADLLRITLKSLLLQDYSNFEVWVIGDGCTDASEETVASLKDARLHWHNLPKNTGDPSAPRNEGIRRAQGTYIAYLGHDDLWFPWHLSSVVKTIEATKADMVCSLAVPVTPNGLSIGNGPPPPPVPVDFHFLQTPTAWIHTRLLTDSCGAWRSYAETLKGVDKEFIRRVIASGRRVEQCPRVTSLTFPAGAWNLYTRLDFPQARYLTRLGTEPDLLCSELFHDGIVTMLRALQQARPFKGLFWRIASSLGRWYGMERWPLRQIRESRSRKSRRNYNARRGLVSASDGSVTPAADRRDEQSSTDS